MISPLPVMVLAAGLGTRLAPLSAWSAKALVPIGDRPALEHVLGQARAVARMIVVNAHHRADDVEAFARAASLGGPAAVPLSVSREPDLLGTAGGLRHAERLLGEGDALVWNSDMIGSLDASALVAAHAGAAGEGALATLAVRLLPPGRTGNVGLDHRGTVVRLRTETLARGPRETRAADFVGVHVVGGELRRRLPEVGCLVGDLYLPALRRGGLIASLPVDVEMIDIGTPAEYLRANLRWLAARGERSWLAEGVEVARDVTLAGVVAGAGAKVLGVGVIESCVVWGGAVATAPLTRSIVTPLGVVSL